MSNPYRDDWMNYADTPEAFTSGILNELQASHDPRVYGGAGAPISAITGQPEASFEDRNRLFRTMYQAPGMVYQNYLKPGLEGMDNLGAGILGRPTPYQVDEVNDPNTVYARIIKDAMDAANRRTWPMDLRREVPPDLRKDAIIRMEGTQDLNESVLKELAQQYE